MKCKNCGTELRANANYCHKCGSKVELKSKNIYRFSTLDEKQQIIYIAIAPIIIFTFVYFLYLSIKDLEYISFTSVIFMVFVLVAEFFASRYIAMKAYDFLKMEDWLKNSNITVKNLVKIIALNVISVIGMLFAILVVFLMAFAKGGSGGSSTTKSSTSNKNDSKKADTSSTSLNEKIPYICFYTGEKRVDGKPNRSVMWAYNCSTYEEAEKYFESKKAESHRPYEFAFITYDLGKANAWRDYR